MNVEIENTAPIEDEALEDVAGGLSLGGAAVPEGAGTDRIVSADTNRWRASHRAGKVLVKENEEKLVKGGQAKGTVAKAIKSAEDKMNM